MTNFEYIKTMNEKQFTEFMYETNLDKCWCEAKSTCHLYNSCSEAFEAWLKSEYMKD
jgi:hypothetical protein